MQGPIKLVEISRLTFGQPCQCSSIISCRPSWLGDYLRIRSRVSQHSSFRSPGERKILAEIQVPIHDMPRRLIDLSGSIVTKPLAEII